MKLTRLLLLVITVAAFVAMAGCRPQVSPQDADSIKRNYTDFRNVVMSRDAGKATTFASSDLVALYTPEKILASFEYLTNSNMKTGSHTRVSLDRNSKGRAWLFPGAPPTVGYAFVKETNVWKITLDVCPVLD